MTTPAPAAHLIQDQNIHVNYNGSSLSLKRDISKMRKKGLGGRRALNDISNSGDSSACRALKRDNSVNLISIGKDPDASKTASATGWKANFSKAPDKSQVGVRKALGDLTNSGKPSLQQVPKKNNLGKKLSVVAEVSVPSDIMGEGFLHDHQECIKQQRKAMDMDCFLKAVGLDDGNKSWYLFNCFVVATLFVLIKIVLLSDTSTKAAASPLASAALSSKLKSETPLKLWELEEMPELLPEAHVPRCGKKGEGYITHACGSPKSPKLPYGKWGDDNFQSFTLLETPKVPKY